METKGDIGCTVLITVLTVFTVGLLDICECSSCVSGPVTVTYSVANSGSQPSSEAECTSASGISVECWYCSNYTFVCSTLDAALNELEGLSLSTAEFVLGDEGNVSTVALNYGHNISQAVDHLSLRGLGSTTVNCEGGYSKDGAWIYLERVSSLLVTNLTWKQCGSGNSDHPGSVITTMDCDNVTIISVNFSSSLSTAIKCTNAVLVAIEHGNFYSGQAVALEINNNNTINSTLLEISNSYFVSNGNEDEDGGGVRIISFSPSGLLHIIIDGTTFKGNRAQHGGGIFIKQFHSCPYMNVTITDTVFTYNYAESTGGAIFYSIIPKTTSKCLLKVISCTDCSFMQNTAKSSLAIHTGCYEGPDQIPCELYLTKSNFMSNFQQASVAYGYDRFSCSNLVINTAITASDVAFSRNQASALCLLHSTLKVYGTVNFDSNRAFIGGAMNVIGEQSRLLLISGSVWNFTNNSAVYGGAIYQTASLSGWGPCIFQPSRIGDEGMVSATNKSKNATMIFVDNQVTIAGMSVYYNQPGSNCPRSDSSNDYIMTFDPKVQDQNGSVATNITFLQNLEYVAAARYKMSLVLGQYLVFNANVTDFFSNNSSAPVNVVMQVNSTFVTSPLPNLMLTGSRVISINHGKTITDILFTGQEVEHNQTDTTAYSLLLVGLVTDVSSNTTITVDLSFEPCPLGWYHNTEKGMCMCYNSPSILCSESTSENVSACIKVGYWFGIVGAGNKSSTTVTYCPAGFCHSTRAGGNQTCHMCPLTQENDYCLLPVSEYDEQCSGNRSNVTCSLCRKGYSFTFGAVECVPTSKCSPEFSFLLVLFSFLFIVTLVVMMIVVLKANYQLKSGYTFAFVYYFSIVRLLLPFDFPNKGIRIVISIFESYTQMNPRFLGYIPFCFGQGATALSLIGLQYLFPFLASICIMIIVLFISYCPYKVRWIRFNDSTIVRSFTILVFLSFTSLTKTSFGLLNPVRFDKVSTTYVFFEPTVVYFTGIHVFWVLLAGFIELFLITPFILLLFLAPFLMRFKRLRLIRLKPYLDEFQSCYKDEYRWMAFYYFFCRQMYLLMLLNPTANLIPIQYYMQLISIMVAVFHTSLQPYADTWLNILDTILLTDLVLVSVLYGEAGLYVFYNYSSLQNAIAYILIFIPIVYILLLPVLLKLKELLTRQNRRSYSIRTHAVPERTCSTRTRPLIDSNLFKDREPLIGLLNEDDPTTASYLPPQADSTNSDGSVGTESTENDTIVEIQSPERVRATSFFLTDGSVGYQVHTIAEKMPRWKSVTVSTSKRKDKK